MRAEGQMGWMVRRFGGSTAGKGFIQQQEKKLRLGLNWKIGEVYLKTPIRSRC